MKKLSYIFLCVALAVSVSCNNEAIEIERSLDIIADATNILDPFTEYKAGDFDLDDDMKVKAMILLYDEEGDLITYGEGSVSGFDKKPHLSVNVDYMGKIRCIALMYVATDDMDFCTIEGISSLSKLKIQQLYQYYQCSFIAVGEKLLEDTDSQVVLNLKLVGGLIYHHWTNVHAVKKEGTEADKYLYCFHNNDIMKWSENGWTYSSSLSQVNNNAASITVSNCTGNNYYEYYVLFPGNRINTFGRYLIGNNRYDTDPLEINVEDGKQYKVDYMCLTDEIEFTTATKSSTSNVFIRK